MRSWLAAVLLITACTVAKDERDHVCTLVGCDSFVRIEMGTFPASEFQDQSPYADVEVCLNELCTHVLVDVFPGNDDFVETRVGDFVPGPQMVVGLHAKPSSDIAMTVTVRADDGTVFHDGDICQVTFRRFDGAIVASGSWSVAYKTAFPNGPMCDPTCRQAMTVTPI
jgi:hypothetical protein